MSLPGHLGPWLLSGRCWYKLGAMVRETIDAARPQLNDGAIGKLDRIYS